MGLFYTALERADQAAAEALKGNAAAAEAAEGNADAEPSPAMTWQEAAQRDFAGYPLDRVADGAAGGERYSAALLESGAPWPAVQFNAERLRLAANDTGIAREQYRILRTRVLEAMRGQQRRSLLITSAGAGEGKTMVAVNLALQLSSLKEARVLLIDADLRRAGLTESLCPVPKAGLGHLLKGEASLDALLYAVDPWLTVLPTRPMQEDGAELLAGHRVVELLQAVRKRFDLVLLDSAPVGPVADSRILARLVDASLLVVRHGAASSEEIAQAADLLRPTLLGSVLNGADEPRNRDGYSDAEARPDHVRPTEAQS